MSLNYHAGDELRDWQATIVINGVLLDFTSGYTFEVKLVDSTGTVALTKTSNITGAAGGVVTTAWAIGDLALTPGRYTAQLRVSRNSDSRDFSLTDLLYIGTRY